MMESIVGLDVNTIIVRVGDSFAARAHFNCLFNPEEHLWGDVSFFLFKMIELLVHVIGLQKKLMGVPV